MQRLVRSLVAIVALGGCWACGGGAANTPAAAAPDEERSGQPPLPPQNEQTDRAPMATGTERDAAPDEGWVGGERTGRRARAWGEEVPTSPDPRSDCSRTAADDRWQVRSLATPRAEPAWGSRPRPVGARDIRVHHARVDNVMRLLANVGRFNLVIADEFTKMVSLELRRVEPYDALLVLAESHGGTVRYERGIVTVSHK